MGKLIYGTLDRNLHQEYSADDFHNQIREARRLAITRNDAVVTTTFRLDGSGEITIVLDPGIPLAFISD